MVIIGIYFEATLGLHFVSPSNPQSSGWNVGNPGPSGRIVAHPWAGWYIEESAEPEIGTDIAA